MNKKKSRKRTNLTPNRKLINIFLTIFLIAFLVTIASYFTIKNKEANKDIPPQVSTQEIKDEISIPPRIAEIKDLKEQINHELFEKKFDLNEEHKFEEYTKELEKVIDEKTEIEESINKENKIIQKIHKIYGFFYILWYNMLTWFLGRMLNEVQRLLQNT
mgnify:CR=1 FL=1